MNMNKVALKVTLLEGKKISLSIAQVKEVLNCLRAACRKKEVAAEVIWYLFKTKEKNNG